MLPPAPALSEDSPDVRRNFYKEWPILGQGSATAQGMMRYFTRYNPVFSTSLLKELIQLYREEAQLEGVNPDIAFCQMCHETDFLRFGGQVNAQQNNFAGIGVWSKHHRGAQFNSPREGVRTHIQLLKHYASPEGPSQPWATGVRPLRPRAQAPCLKDLTGVWATDPEYDGKLSRHLASLYYFNNSPCTEDSPTDS